jgi:hypothetical protein
MRLSKNRITAADWRPAPAADRPNETTSLPDRLRNYIVEFPRSALAVAAVAGVLAGWWVKR